ncbi:PREDICTED: mite group 2 allergen Pso o 2-like, partial [Rhagoletis zephyria]|uniref:mite group 2 allergen Pso o 2-like n=1 Tax=Rhagoletis zephyria TaxID=28612 RepID=UPI000811A070
HKEVTSLDIAGCAAGHTQSVCPMVKGKEFVLSFDFVANSDSAKVAFKFTADLGGGVVLPVPGTDNDACHHMKCPVVKGQKVAFKYPMVVPKVLPNLKAVVAATLVGDHGTLACVQINGGVQD